jgi:cytochrome c oxidase subunit II
MSWLREFMLPHQASTTAAGYDTLFMFITGLAIFFFVIVAVMLGLFVLRYRRRGPDEVTPHITHNFRLELVWSIVPLLLVIVIFFWGFHGFMVAQIAPGESMEISVTAKKWQWEFEYPDGMRSLNELHVPVNQNVRIILTSLDVIHSFYVPAFRVKKDAVPGRYTELWFNSMDPGTYQLFCAEYCGKGHSDMLGKIVVESKEGYERWLREGDEQLKSMPLPELGRLIWENRGCATCHSLTGEKGQGPSWKGIWGEDQKMTDGTVQHVDENYVRESILFPQKHIVLGYEGIMPTYQGLLREREIQGVIAFIKSLK